MKDDPRALLHRLFEAAVAAGAPSTCLPPHMPPPPRGRTVVVGAGKSAAAMARVVEAETSGWVDLSGLVVTRYGHCLATRQIDVIEARHPVPDEAGQAAAQRIVEAVSGLGADDLALFLISGGGSALLSLPAPGLSLADKQAVTRDLLRSGAAISEINCLRKHLSAVKGGQLAVAAAPARICALVISDVPGDDPADIASGPTVADATTFADAQAVLEKYRIAVPPAVARHLAAAENETPKPGDTRLGGACAVVIASAQHALAAAKQAARQAGVEPVMLGDALEGEARELAARHARLARSYLNHGHATVLLSGGEVTVTVRGEGRGGPNTEYLLALASALDGAAGVFAIACDTDGIDGSEDNAGAVISPDTLSRAAALGLDPAAHLANNDAYGFFAALDDLVVTGPTLTNLNDFRALLVLPPS